MDCIPSKCGNLVYRRPNARGRVTERIRAITGKVPCKDRPKLQRLAAIESNAVVEGSQSSIRRRRGWL